MMKRFRGCRLLVLGLVFFALHGCSGQREDDSTTTAPMEEKEKMALYAAIESFVGKGWNGSGLYPDPCGWSPIQGVSCDLFNGLWYPTMISIGPVLDNSLQCAPGAKFSSQLFDLRHLRTLSFYNCFPESNPTAIPTTSWEKLSGSLETLEFRTNPGLAGAIPVSLGRLASLQSLVLVENNLTGVVPAELGALQKLRRLVLSGNGLSGPIPATLGGLRGLLKIDLSNNLLQGSIPPELGGLKNLTLLDLRNNSLSGGLPQFVQGMVSLQDLLLSSNPLGGTLVQSGWEKLANLATLDLSNLGLVGTIPESMAALTGLRFLALDHNHLTGNVPTKLAELPNIGALYLNGNNLTGTLEFSPEFYQKMGRRFASWDNPGLCYNITAVDAVHAPSGVVVCKDLQEPSVGARDKEGGRKPEASSSLMASSFGLSATKVTGFWYLVLVQGMVATSLVLMLL
ncbi:piriformospora indica-insensitive protein 2-like isoform X2 [Phragmites australis]|uniref:piriformospora indica-insensitive protein 2-like isoform X2 n=1 Tax=Phragmites australis TaxID=29695 RepID=UPI002D7A18B1|nr:piriformospora indica-insensitive protein 2-like isoform X2 [Phragmites australis]